MAAPTIGDIVESKCGKCNDVTGHTVMVIVGGAIIKVECRACGSVHRYRAPDGTGTARGTAQGTARAGTGGRTAGASRPAAGGGRTLAGRGRGAQARADAERWEKASVRAINEDVLPYKTTGTYEPGALIRHPVFGLGEVLLVIPPDKMDILFEDGIKRLLCNK